MVKATLKAPASNNTGTNIESATMTMMTFMLSHFSAKWEHYESISVKIKMSVEINAILF